MSKIYKYEAVYSNPETKEGVVYDYPAPPEAFCDAKFVSRALIDSAAYYRLEEELEKQVILNKKLQDAIAALGAALVAKA